MRQHDDPPGENQGSKKHDKQLAMAVARPEHRGNSRIVSLMSGQGTFAWFGAVMGSFSHFWAVLLTFWWRWAVFWGPDGGGGHKVQLKSDCAQKMWEICDPFQACCNKTGKSMYGDRLFLIKNSRLVHFRWRVESMSLKSTRKSGFPGFRTAVSVLYGAANYLHAGYVISTPCLRWK